MDLIYSTINLYDSLKSKYKEYLKPGIISIVIIQSGDGVWLESTETEMVQGDLEKQTTRRINLDFITDGEPGEPDELFFDPKDSIENNARKFINEFSPYSIINTTDLFHEEACEKISKKYNTFGVDR